jgi:hypothetical protein
MAAHAVDGHQEHRMLARSDGDAILVFFSVPDDAQVGVLDLHARSTRLVDVLC